MFMERGFSGTPKQAVRNISDKEPAFPQPRVCQQVSKWEWLLCLLA
jgi:hypothetical protein